MSSDGYCRQHFSLLLLISGCLSGAWRNLADEGVAATGVELGEICKTSAQCQRATLNSTCADGVCACEAGFFTLQKINSSTCESKESDGTGEDYVGTPTPPKVKQQQVDPKMIVIMVVLAIMFVGICVALHLFSKARFRNHRTIFNSPHPRLMHIKLGKKKGRRRASHTSLEVPGSRQLSICSQLSPLQSRRGSQATSPEFSQKARKSNDEKKESAHAHKTKSDPSEKGGAKQHAANMSNGPGSPTVIVSNNKGKAPNTSASARV